MHQDMPYFVSAGSCACVMSQALVVSRRLVCGMTPEVLPNLGIGAAEASIRLA